ncbi:MAG: 3-deoxy-7-phosphoheptulonate synthase [Oligoflexia bacterium]|nr:3-deoxy-7-phosphoheptulonate synthase [Oligoflexia bacterium]
MVIVMQRGASILETKEVLRQLAGLGLEARVVDFPDGPNIVVPGVGATTAYKCLEELPGVKEVRLVSSSFKLSSREFKEQNSVVSLSPQVEVGGSEIALIAGPCAVESEEQIVATAKAVAAAGATALRGGAFKPRTSVYSFQGLGEEGIRLLRIAREESGLPIVTEFLDCESLELFGDDVDVIQIGARSMQNFPLLRAAGESGKPVLLKRAMMATAEELLQSAEYILAAGNPRVILCERGIRSFEPSTRNCLDLNTVAVLKEKSHLPVIVDPSHGTGVARYVAPLSKAAIACGADGLLVEVHVDPQAALSDAAQTINPAQFQNLVEELMPVAQAVGRQISASESSRVASPAQFSGLRGSVRFFFPG